MAFIAHLLKLRWLFVWRSIRSVGIVRQFILLVIVVVAFNYFADQWIKNPSPWLITCIFSAFIFQLHLTRKDKSFLMHQLKIGRKYFITEYVSLFLPFGILLGYYENWIPLSVSLVLILGISLLNASIHDFKLIKTFSFPLPDESFEWKSGLRQKGIILFGLLVCGLVFYRYNFVIPVVMFLNMLIVSTFYSECESNHWIQMSGKSPIKFILGKCKILFSLFWVLHLPLLGLFLFEFSELWLIGIFLFGWISFLLFIILLAKYALFREKETLSALHSFLIVFTSFAPLNILLFPIPVGMFIVLLKKTLRNLEEIIYA